MSTYRGCEIEITETRLADTGRRLYAVSGRLEKSAAVRPFLTSRAAAREWINECDTPMNTWEYDEKSGEYVIRY